MTLKTPVGPNDHAQGPADAPVTLVEYGDYQCPYCGQAYPIVKAVQARFGARLRFVFRNMPLKNAHPQAELAAEAAEAAGAAGQVLGDARRALRASGQLGAGIRHEGRRARLHLDLDAFKQRSTAGQVRGRVEHDFMDGVRSGVNGTPTFFINGTRFDDSWDEETLGAAIEHAIAGGARCGGAQRPSGQADAAMRSDAAIAAPLTPPGRGPPSLSVRRRRVSRRDHLGNPLRVAADAVNHRDENAYRKCRPTK